MIAERKGESRMKCLDYLKYLRIPEECRISYFRNLLKSQIIRRDYILLSFSITNTEGKLSGIQSDERIISPREVS